MRCIAATLLALLLVAAAARAAPLEDDKVVFDAEEADQLPQVTSSRAPTAQTVRNGELAVDLSDLPSGTHVRVTDAGGNRQFNYQGNQARTYAVTETSVTVLVTDGASSITKTVDCTSAASCELTDFLAELSIDLLGLPSGVHVDVLVSSGLKFRDINYVGNQIVLAHILRGQVGITITDGASTRTLTGIDCDQPECNANDASTGAPHKAKLTVNLSGLPSGTHVDLLTSSGVKWRDLNYVGGDELETTILRASGVGVRITDSHSTITVPGIDCEAATCDAGSDFTATLMIAETALLPSGTHVRLHTIGCGSGSTSSVDPAKLFRSLNYVGGGPLTTVVLRGILDVRIIDGPSEHVTKFVDCTSGSCRVCGFVSQLTLDTLGLPSGVHADLMTAQGDKFRDLNYIGNKLVKAFVLSAPGLQVALQDGVSTRTLTGIDCSGVSCNANQASSGAPYKASLSVDLQNFPSGVHIDLLTGGTKFRDLNYVGNEVVETTILRNADVQVDFFDGAASHSVTGIDCDQPACNANDATGGLPYAATLTVNLSGLVSGTHLDLFVGNGIGGGKFRERNYVGGTAALEETVLAGLMEGSISSAPLVKVQTDCSSGTCSIDLSI